MALQMIDRKKRFAACHGQRFSGHHAHKHAADQAGAGCGGNCVELGQGYGCIIQRFGDNIVDEVGMCTRGYFRHNAAILGMVINLRMNDIGENLGPGIAHTNNRGGGFIAAGFDSQQGYGLAGLLLHG